MLFKAMVTSFAMLQRLGVSGIKRALLSSSSLSSTSVPKIVDAWTQPAEPSFYQAMPEVARLLQQSRTPMDKLGELGPDGLVALMDQAGIHKILLCAWSRPGSFPLPNETIAKYTKAFPDRIVGIGAVDLQHPMKAVKQLETCVKEYGFKGVRVLPWLWDRPPTDRLFYPVFVKCVELGVPFATQVGHTGPLCPSEPGRPVPYIDQVALDFPELVIVGGHIGYPWTDEMIGIAWKHPNVYIDTSAHAPQYYPKQLIQFMNSYGSRKVLFGTNFPQLQFDNCVKQAKELPLKEKAMENFLWRNANRVYGLGMD